MLELFAAGWDVVLFPGSDFVEDGVAADMRCGLFGVGWGVSIWVVVRMFVFFAWRNSVSAGFVSGCVHF